MGILQWSPSQFWKATPSDLYWALKGWQEKNGIEPDEGDTQDEAAFITMDELQELMERFPD